MSFCILLSWLAELCTYIIDDEFMILEGYAKQ